MFAHLVWDTLRFRTLPDLACLQNCNVFGCPIIDLQVAYIDLRQKLSILALLHR